MRIANNVIGLNVTNNMNKANRRIDLSMGRLSSGTKINRAKDDSAGYAITTRLDMQVQGFNRGSENALDGVSLLQTAEGALSSVQELLQRCRELAVQASNDTYTVEDRRLIQNEIQEYKEEVDAICKKTTFNSIDFLNGQAQRVIKGQNTDTSAITLVSDNLDPGILDYTVNSIGQHAIVPVGYNGTQTSPVDGLLNINGSEVKISATDSATDIYSKILKACADSDIEFDTTNGQFISAEAGSNASITISGDSAILSSLGFSEVTNYGTDASVTFNSYTKTIDGSIDQSFRPLVTTDGNKVTLVGQDNKVVEILIKDTNPKTGVLYPIGTSFNQKSEITDSGQLNMQLGGKTNAVLAMYIQTVNIETLEVEYANVSTQQGAERAIQSFDDAISEVSGIRATLGAYENRLNYSSESLLVASDSTTVSLSRIRDTNMAKEMANYSKDNVIYQAGTSILAQANQRPQLVLQLIK